MYDFDTVSANGWAHCGRLPLATMLKVLGLGCIGVNDDDTVVAGPQISKPLPLRLQWTMIISKDCSTSVDKFHDHVFGRR
jgi:hypothetical protein